VFRTWSIPRKLGYSQREQGAQRPILAQVLQQRFHPQGALYRISEKLIGLPVEFALILSCQQLRVADHHAQRFLQVVGSRVGDMLELFVYLQQQVFRLGNVIYRKKDQRCLVFLMWYLAGTQQET